MKKFITYCTDFFRKDYTFGVYGTLALFLAISISLNYIYSFEEIFLSQPSNRYFRFIRFMAFYSFAYYSVWMLYLIFYKENYFTQPKIFLKSFTAIALIAFDSAFGCSDAFLQSIVSVNEQESYLLRKILNQCIPTFVCGGVLFLYYRFDSKQTSFYGLRKSGIHWSPYLYMALLMTPLLAIASFQSSFTEQYPFFKYWQFENTFALAPTTQFSIYEFFYLVNFTGIELLFRGFLVIGLMHSMDKRTVLPMVALYAFLHFGKPPLETISSIFGGYLLGVVAYKTENISGGVLLHIFIALFMDVCAILHFLYSS